MADRLTKLETHSIEFQKFIIWIKNYIFHNIFFLYFA